MRRARSSDKTNRKNNVKTGVMRAYEVFLNGKRLCVAGVRDGYVSAYITYRSEPQATWLDVMGLDNRKKQSVRWAAANLRSGDEIVLKVVDRKSVDKSTTIRRLDEKKDFAVSLKRWVRAEVRKLAREVRENAQSDIWSKLQSPAGLGTLNKMDEKFGFDK